MNAAITGIASTDTFAIFPNLEFMQKSLPTKESKSAQNYIHAIFDDLQTLQAE